MNSFFDTRVRATPTDVATRGGINIRMHRTGVDSTGIWITAVTTIFTNLVGNDSTYNPGNYIFDKNEVIIFSGKKI